MILEEVVCGSLLAPVLDHGDGAPDDLPLVALGVQLAKADVLAQLHVIGHGQQRNLMLLAKAADQLHVQSFVAVFRKNAQQSLKEAKNDSG